MSDIENPFVRLSAINVNGKTEKKRGFTYLSWAFAVDELMKADPKANWEIHEPKFYGQQVMVSCTVTAFGKPVYMWLPVMNNNAPLKDPSVIDINKAQMRCLVKAIACHGLGLYIYAGEDLPNDSEQAQVATKVATNKQKQKLGDKRFSDACIAVNNGQFDKVRLLTEFDLTVQQRKIAKEL